MAAWPVGRPFPMHRAMQEVSLAVIMRLRTVFGFEETARLERLRQVILRLAVPGG